MKAGWTFYKRSSQLCKDMFIFTHYRGMGVNWKKTPWKGVPDSDDKGWHFGPVYYPTDFGACCHLAPHLHLNPNLENKTYEELYRDVKADAFNGRQNGLKIILDAEQFNYADQKNDAAGFQIAMHHHRDKPMLQFSSQLLHTGTHKVHVF